ncbi:MAG: hypothetical protein ABJA84_08145 [Polaromonas sp.]
MNPPQKLELAWIGKDQRPRLEPRILLEGPKRSYLEQPLSRSTSLQSVFAVQWTLV